MAIAGYSEDAADCCPTLVGEKWLTLGGGSYFNVDSINSIATSVDIIKSSSTEYTGVLFDIETVYGSSSVLVEAFAAAFKAMKDGGFKVGVTTSHSAPYETDTPEVAVDLVNSWVKDSNIDFISPQLYTSGTETEPNFDETWNCLAAGCTWDLYVGMIPRMVPSIVEESQYPATESFFSDYGIQTTGFFQWQQQTTAPEPSQQTTAPVPSQQTTAPAPQDTEIIGYYS